MNTFTLKLNYPLAAEFAGEHAEVLVAQIRENQGVSLDYSVPSLTGIDELLDSWRDQGAGVEDIPSTLFRAGCYLGEVVRRARSATWVNAEDHPAMDQGEDFRALLLLKFPDGHLWSPIRTAFRKGQLGKEVSLRRAGLDQLSRPAAAPDEIALAGDVAGFALAQTIASICSRGEYEPVLAVENDQGQRTHHAFVGWDSFLPALQAGREKMAETTPATRVKVLVYHAEFRLNNLTGHAVFAEFGYPALLAGLIVEVPYTPASPGQPVQFQPLQIRQIPDAARAYADRIMHAMLTGAEKHQPAWRAWQTHVHGARPMAPDRPATTPLDRTAANAATHAKNYLAQIHAATGVALDYSVDALDHFEQNIALWKRQRKSSAELAEIIFHMGCFAGEVLAQKRAGEWVDEAAYPEPAGASGVPYVIGLRFADGHIWKPIKIIIERLEHSSPITVAESCRQEMERPIFSRALLQEVGDFAGKLAAGYVADLLAGHVRHVCYGIVEHNGTARFFNIKNPDHKQAVAGGMNLLAEKTADQIKVLIYQSVIGSFGEQVDAVSIAFGKYPWQMDDITLAVPLPKGSRGRRYEVQPICAVRAPERMRCMLPDVINAVFAGVKKNIPAWELWYHHMPGVAPAVTAVASRRREIVVFSDQRPQSSLSMETLLQGSRMAGQQAGLQMLTLAKGGETSPRYAALSPDGRVSVDVIAGTFVAAIEEGRSKLFGRTADQVNVLVFDGRMAVATGVDSHGEPILETVDTLSVEFGSALRCAAGLVLVVPFRHADDAQPFVLMPVQVMQSPESWFEHHEEILQAFSEGVQQNEAGWLWRAHLRADLAPPAAIAKNFNKPVPDASTKGVYWISVDQGKPQQLDLQIDIAAAVAGLGALEQDYARIDRPFWMTRPAGMEADPLCRLLDDYPILLREGRVVWAHMVQANSALFEPGQDDLPAEFLYDPEGISPAELAPVAAQLGDLKGTVPTDPALRRIAEHLTAEMTREFALPVPYAISEAHTMLMSTAMVCRKHLPNGFLNHFFVPVLISDRCPGSLMILPSRWWPAAFAAAWVDDHQPLPSAAPTPEEEKLKRQPTPQEFRDTADAAKQGSAEAQYQLAVYYLNGIGTLQNDSQAAYWLNNAARQGYVDAQFTLGVLHFMEDGPIAHDRAAAVGWFRKAAAQGHDQAKRHLQAMGIKEYGPESEPEDPETAEGQFQLGREYEEKRKNLTKAARWYAKAAAQGHTEAIFELAVMTLTGTGVRRDLAKAVDMLKQAAESGHAGAQFELGTLYATGEGVDKDRKIAASWYQKAAAQGHGDAQNGLARLRQWWKPW